MVLNFGQISNMFPNSRAEELGIGEKEKEVSSSVAKLFTDQYALTTSFAEVPGMTLTHECKTGRVLVLFSAWVAPLLTEEVRVKLQKDTVDVGGSLRSLADVSQTDVTDMNCAIMHVDKNVGLSTWRIVAKSTGVNSFVNDRELIIIDI